MVPRSAMVFYGEDTASHYSTVEMFEVRRGLLVNPRRPNNDQLQTLGKLFMGQSKDRSSLHGSTRGILWVKDSAMAFQCKAKVRRLAMPEPMPKLAEYYVPQTLFTYEGPGHSMSVYWRLPWGRPSYVPAPMPNISINGALCLGSSMQGVSYVPNMQQMKKICLERFWGSKFTEMRTFLPIVKRMHHAAKRADAKIWFWDGKGEGAKELAWLVERPVNMEHIINTLGHVAL